MINAKGHFPRYSVTVIDGSVYFRISALDIRSWGWYCTVENMFFFVSSRWSSREPSPGIATKYAGFMNLCINECALLSIMQKVSD
jgi:hypothetical protein